ncbi:lamina-associated polypeptide 2, isoforms beta/gamma-like [Cyprinodon tularosa]|uniref:lamina-associated polypeptide 2, isoforms beta/gamma-like n=1 Tax=Cyprinodon tularosa TaxID=77115 RepID=UPI0018E256E4|nr:lamina-associated polypeptide 2, isoforms beta/gamma-like [Cyprinodon tularosa]
MPLFLEDPRVLTKEQLRSQLLAHSVELPGGNPTKDVFVQLYLNKLTAQNQERLPAAAPDAFSSDEEAPPVAPSRSRSSGKKTPRKSEKLRLEEVDVTSLTDEGLRDELQKYGVSVGPIVASTRKLYEKKLQKFLDDGPAQPVSNQIPATLNGNAEADVYSDKEDEPVAVPEPEPEPEAEPVPVVERRARSGGKTPVSSRSGSSRQQKVEKISASEQKVEEDVLTELFTGDMNSPTGISATCRKPIRGAAGRPLISSEVWNEDFSKTAKTSSFSYTGSHAVNRVSSGSASSSASSSTSSSTSYATLAVTAPTRAPRRSTALWKKLALVGVLGAFLVFVYLAMETNSVGPFQA